MAVLDGRKVLTTKLDAAQVPWLALRTARCLIHRPDIMRLVDADRRTRRQARELDDPALAALAAGDGGLLRTWQARVEFGRRYLFAHDAPISGRREALAQVNRWSAASTTPWERVLMHAVVDACLNTRSPACDETAAALAPFFEQVFDPTVALSVMSLTVLDRLFFSPRPYLSYRSPAHYKEVNQYIERARADWLARTHGIRFEDLAGFAVLAAGWRREHRSGDTLFLQRLMHARGCPGSPFSHSPDNSMVWLKSLPLHAFEQA